MPAMHISRSIEINATAETIYSSVRNFKEWPQWSPWLVAEPNTELNYAGDGKSYTWSGKYVGAGENTIIDEKPNEFISYDLLFLKPWKSKAKFRLEMAPASDGKTTVTWTMDSSLPIFMFWFKSMMETMIGMDYERGLAMLKDLVETGSVPVKLEFGETTVGPFEIVGIRTECAISDIGAAMSADIEKLKSWIAGSHIGETGKLMSVYHKWELSKGRTTYTTGFPVSKVPDSLPDGIVSLTIPGISAATVKFTGPYRHISNAWNAGIMRSRSGAFKQSKKHHPFELYENSPEDTAENDLVTTVHFPLA